MVLLSKPSLHIALFLGSCLWSSSLLAPIFVAADPLTRDQLYAQNGFVQNWVAPMPSSPIRAASGSSNNNSGEKYLVQNWKTTFNTIAIGGDDISFVTDPFGGQPAAAGGTGTGTNSSVSNQVLQLFYPKGSYAPSMGITGGTQFYAAPFGQQQFSKMMVSYDVAFPDGFIWQNGGKLPGIYGGAPYDGCSGGAQAAGANCATMRLMWRGSGAGEGNSLFYVRLLFLSCSSFYFRTHTLTTFVIAASSVRLCSSGSQVQVLPDTRGAVQRYLR